MRVLIYYSPLGCRYLAELPAVYLFLEAELPRICNFVLDLWAGRWQIWKSAVGARGPIPRSHQPTSHRQRSWFWEPSAPPDQNSQADSKQQRRRWDDWLSRSHDGMDDDFPPQPHNGGHRPIGTVKTTAWTHERPSREPTTTSDARGSHRYLTCANELMRAAPTSPAVT